MLQWNLGFGSKYQSILLNTYIYKFEFSPSFLGMYLLDVGDIIYIYICRGIHALILERLLGKVYFKFIFTKNSSLGNFRIKENLKFFS